MQLRVLYVSLAAVAFGLFGCGNNTSGFDGDGGVDGNADGSGFDGGFGFGDTGTAEAGCVGLQCQQTCGSTTISGKVYDPRA